MRDWCSDPPAFVAADCPFESWADPRAGGPGYAEVQAVHAGEHPLRRIMVLGTPSAVAMAYAFKECQLQVEALARRPYTDAVEV